MKSKIEETFVALITPRTGLCVDFTNIGTNNPMIMNNCRAFTVATVKNWGRDGRVVATRHFHLNSGETRPLAFPGYEMAVSSIGNWAQSGGDDGSRFLHVQQMLEDTFTWWEVRNSNSGQFNAVSFHARTDSQDYDVIYAIPPGQRINLWGAFEDQNPRLYLNWAELDPL